MTSSLPHERPGRPATPAPSVPPASWVSQFDKAVFDMGLTHFQLVSEGQVNRLTTSQQVIGAAAIYYSAGRMLLDGISLLTLSTGKRSTKRRRKRGA